jgi:uncharacterized membrane protein YvlD (DUF360 family)
VAPNHAPAMSEVAPQQPAYARLPRELLRSRPFNWRVIVVRLFVYGLALGIASPALPGLDIRPFEGREIYTLMLLAAIFGITMAVFRPLLQTLALPFLIETGGLIVALLYVALFAIFDAFTGSLIDMRGAGSFFAAGLVVAVLVLLFENLLGVPEPILSDIPPELEEEVAP